MAIFNSFLYVYQSVSQTLFSKVVEAILYYYWNGLEDSNSG
jgi:hypothetical protein